MAYTQPQEVQYTVGIPGKRGKVYVKIPSSLELGRKLLRNLRPNWIAFQVKQLTKEEEKEGSRKFPQSPSKFQGLATPFTLWEQSKAGTCKRGG